MRLLDRLLSRDTGGYWEGMASGSAVLTTTYGSPGREPILPALAAVARDQYEINGVVFAAIQARIALFSQITFKLQSLSDKRLIGNQSLSVLEHPWPDGTTAELLARMEQDVSLTGNAFIWDAGDQLVRLRPDWTTIISEIKRDPVGRPYRVPVGYFYEPPVKTAVPGAGEAALYTAAEVAHWWPIPDPDANFRGMSWLTPVMREIRADSGMTGYKIKYLENAASPNLLLRYSQKLQPGTVDSLRERIQARYGGVDNAFRTLILDQGADATVIGNNLQQMDFSGVQQSGADRILADSGVPGVLVGLEPLRGAGRGYQESMTKFGTLWAIPQWVSVCGALAKLVPGLPPQGLRLWYDTSGIDALQDSVPVQAQANLVRAQAILTLTQAGYSRESVVTAVETGDYSQLQPDPAALAAAQQARQPQHMLPQPPGSGPVAAPLPPGTTPRLPAAAPGVSPGSQGRETAPARRPASVRREANGHG